MGSKINAFRKVVEEKQMQAFDFEGNQPDRLVGIYDTEAPVLVSGDMFIDLFTASCVVQVYDALSPENQTRLEEFSLYGMADISLKLAAKSMNR